MSSSRIVAHSIGRLNIGVALCILLGLLFNAGCDAPENWEIHNTEGQLQMERDNFELAERMFIEAANEPEIEGWSLFRKNRNRVVSGSFRQLGHRYVISACDYDRALENYGRALKLLGNL